MKHLDGLGLISAPARKKAAELLVSLFLICGGASPIEALGARLRRDERGQIGDLLGLKRDQLVAGLGCLQLADGRLARRDERISFGARRVQIPDHASLNSQRVLMTNT